MPLPGPFWFLTHPLNRGRRLKAFGRFLKWQIGSRLVPGPVAIDFVSPARLLIRPGMTGATVNLYAGLYEFEDMAFLLHMLREDDLFVDVGANIGSYTILAGAVAKAQCVSFEPAPQTFRALLDNVHLNGIGKCVGARNVAVGSGKGTLRFTTSLDAVNHVATERERDNVIEVPVVAIDEALDGRQPLLIKIDVEGFETEVVKGAAQTLRGSAPLAVIMELNGSGREYGYDEEAIRATMWSYGFSAFCYDPVSRVLSPADSNRPDNTLFLRGVDFFQARVARGASFRVHEQVF